MRELECEELSVQCNRSIGTVKTIEIMALFVLSTRGNWKI